METATIGGSQDERERWPQEYTTMPYTQTHTQSGSQLPDKPGGGMAQGGVAGAVAVAVEGGGERGGWQGQEQGLAPASANKRTGQNCACNQFQVCAARGLFEKAIPLPHSPNLRPVSTSLSSPQSPLPTNRQRRLSSEKYATLSSWTRLCCCCFISPLPCLPSHTAHRDSDAGRFGHVKSR